MKVNTHLIPSCSESGTTWHSGLDYHEVVPVPKKGSTTQQRKVRLTLSCAMRLRLRNEIFPLSSSSKRANTSRGGPIGEFEQLLVKKSMLQHKKNKKNNGENDKKKLLLLPPPTTTMTTTMTSFNHFLLKITKMVSSQHKACLVYLCSGVLVRHPVQLWHCGISPFWKAVATNCNVQSPWVHFP